MDQSRTRLWTPSRRQVIATGASALALSSVAGFAPPLAVARGSVFADDDGSGVRRPGSRGLPGVLVSNGRDVVRTDAEGRWGLPVNALAVAWGLFMTINLVWPRQSIYNASEPFRWYLRWGGVLFVGAVMLGGFAYYWLVQRHRTGTLAEHAAVAQAETSS